MTALPTAAINTTSPSCTDAAVNTAHKHNNLRYIPCASGMQSSMHSMYSMYNHLPRLVTLTPVFRRRRCCTPTLSHPHRNTPEQHVNVKTCPSTLNCNKPSTHAFGYRPSQLDARLLLAQAVCTTENRPPHNTAATATLALQRKTKNKQR